MVSLSLETAAVESPARTAITPLKFLFAFKYCTEDNRFQAPRLVIISNEVTYRAQSHEIGHDPGPVSDIAFFED